ncbi:MAG: holo-ACP synthase [Pseudomonadota bacterium]
MVFGIGTDVCDLRRMAAVLDRRGERFAEKVLGPNEIEVFRARRAQVEARGIAYLGSRFAAKEAFSKAIGLGLRAPMAWRDCETLNLPGGQPSLQLHGALAEWCTERGLRAHVSLSDETGHAVAFVLIERFPTP